MMKGHDFDEPVITQQEVAAEVKWFNTVKGFGFVQLNDGTPDAFLHISVVEQSGHRDLPEGTKIEMVITYDNSSNNPSNPFDPPQRIRWGLQSTEEMGGITLLMVAKDERDSNQLRRAIRTSANLAMRGGGAQSGMASILISRLRMSDKNGDGKLDADELPERYRRYMQQLDTNKDGVLDFKELERLNLRR